MKKSLVPFGVLRMTDIVSQLPSLISLLVFFFMTKRFTMLFSNVPGPKKPLHFCGIKSQHLGGLIPGTSEVCNGFGALTHCNTLRLSFQADTANCKDARAVMSLLEKNIKKVMAMKK